MPIQDGFYWTIVDQSNKNIWGWAHSRYFPGIERDIYLTRVLIKRCIYD